MPPIGAMTTVLRARRMTAQAATLSLWTAKFSEGNQVFSGTKQEFIADSSLVTMMSTRT